MPHSNRVPRDEVTKRKGKPLQLLLQGAPQGGGIARRVLKFIAENREIVLASSAADLGARLCTSDATIVRTVQAAGFAGLNDLKAAILESLTAASSPADNMRRTLAELASSTGSAVDNVLAAHAEGLNTLASKQCRAQIAEAVHALDAAERIVIFGIGPSSALATYVSILLARAGRRSRVLNVTGGMLADQLLDLQSGDVVLLLAYGGLYPEVAAVLDEAKSQSLPTVLMTESAGTPLAKLADVVVALPRGRPGNVALHGGTLVALEAIVLALAAARPDDALMSLDRLNSLRRAIGAKR
jgi:DNA-binding MurR/RpiR family transcriptional regulator